jgi:hypothetical protein
MSNSFLTQVAMVVLSAGILFFYVKPAFVEIGVTQDSILQYQEEREKVNEVNSRLTELVNRMNSISASDMKALLVYMPDTIDHVAISRDIFFMAEQAQVDLQDVIYSVTPQTLIPSDLEVPFPHAFTVSVDGTYLQIKVFLSMLEQNNYPLEVYDFKITSSELGLLKAEMQLITYSHLDAEASTLVGIYP